MADDTNVLRYDPTIPLLASGNRSLAWFARRDLCGEQTGDITTLWSEPAALKILKGQKPNGSWRYGGTLRDDRDRNGHDIVETFRQLGVLICKFGFDRRHEAIRQAAEFLFGCQSDEGDFRGVYGTQYATTYSPMIGELLIKAGYADDPRVIRSMEWLFTMRQGDGGWAVPLRTLPVRYVDVVYAPEPLQPARSKPFSHLATGCAMRALAAHPAYRHLPDTLAAARLLLSRLWKRDRYPDRGAPSYWTEFSYPYWFTDMLNALDALLKIGMTANEPEIARPIRWFVDRQSPDGTWDTLKLLRGKDKQLPLWLTLQISRVLLGTA